jgi:hypothetical protein
MATRRTVTNYTVVKDATVANFVVEIEKLLGEGWEPFWGPWTDYRGVLHQSMVIKQDVED